MLKHLLNTRLINLINPVVFFGIEGHVALDRNLGPGYNTLLLQLIPGDLLSACPHRQFTHYPAFKTVGLHCQTATLTPACHAGRQFVPYYECL